MRLGRISTWWYNFINGAMVSEEWRENFCMSRLALIDFSEKMCPHVEGTIMRMRASVDVFTKVACAL